MWSGEPTHVHLRDRRGGGTGPVQAKHLHFEARSPFPLVELRTTASRSKELDSRALPQMTEEFSPLEEILSTTLAWEDLVTSGVRKPIQLVAIGSAIRIRRTLAAIVLLTPAFGYEARPLVRTAFELHINYAWMRLRQPHSRAIRFLRYQALEKLRWAETLVGGSDAQAKKPGPVVKALRRRRSKLRYLFYTKKTKKWAKHWASVPSFEGRVRQVMGNTTSDGGSFLYTLYRWLSSGAHGEAQSFEDVLTRTQTGIRERSEQALQSTKEAEAAAALLIATWVYVAEDFALPREVRADIKGRMTAFVAELSASRLRPDS